MKIHVPTKVTSVIFETKFDDDVVLLNCETGACFSLSGSGLVLWNLIDGHASQQEISLALVEVYGVDAQAAELDVAAFMLQLKTAGFVIRN